MRKSRNFATSLQASGSILGSNSKTEKALFMGNMAVFSLSGFTTVNPGLSRERETLNPVSFNYSGSVFLYIL